MATELDLIILGAGSGGVAASRRAAAHGARVAIVEGSRVGGTCVLRGCVPKKLLMYAAQLGDNLHEARGYGWQVPGARFDMPTWATAKATETTRLEGIYEQMLAASGVAVQRGWAHLAGPNTVQLGDQTLTAPHIVIATGAAPVADSIPGIDLCASSDDLLDLTHLPDRAAVIGGGYIGVEFASMLARLGVQVHLFHRGPLPLRGFDDLLRAAAVSSLQAAGVVLHAGSVPQRIQRTGDALVLLMGEDRMLSFPWVLNATGRRPNSARLGGGLALDTHGAVKVDDQCNTNLPGVYAIGDVTNRKNLTPVAIAEGRALADRLFSPSHRPVDLSRVASAVFMLPPLASVGPTEAEALAAGHRLTVFETDFRPMKQAFIGGTERTAMKLLVDADSDRVLAVHMAGADAPEIVQSLAVALTAGATKADFDRTVALHPSAAEEFVLMRQASRSAEPASPLA